MLMGQDKSMDMTTVEDLRILCPDVVHFPIIILPCVATTMTLVLNVKVKILDYSCTQ